MMLMTNSLNNINHSLTLKTFYFINISIFCSSQCIDHSLIRISMVRDRLDAALLPWMLLKALNLFWPPSSPPFGKEHSAFSGVTHDQPFPSLPPIVSPSSSQNSRTQQGDEVDRRRRRRRCRCRQHRRRRRCRHRHRRRPNRKGWRAFDTTLLPIRGGGRRRFGKARTSFKTGLDISEDSVRRRLETVESIPFPAVNTFSNTLQHLFRYLSRVTAPTANPKAADAALPPLQGLNKIFFFAV